MEWVRNGLPCDRECHYQIVMTAWGRSVLDQPGRKRFGGVSQQLVDEGVTRSSAISWRSNAKIRRSSACRLLTAVVGKRMHWHGEVASELFGERIAYSVAFGDDRPDTEAGPEGLDACELPVIVQFDEPVRGDNRFRLSGEIEDDARGRVLEPPPNRRLGGIRARTALPGAGRR